MTWTHKHGRLVSGEHLHVLNFERRPLGWPGGHGVDRGVLKRATSKLESEVKAAPSRTFEARWICCRAHLLALSRDLRLRFACIFAKEFPKIQTAFSFSRFGFRQEQWLGFVNHHGESLCLSCGCKERRIPYEWQTAKCLYQVYPGVTDFSHAGSPGPPQV